MTKNEIIYAQIDALLQHLRELSHTKLAEKISHRMFEVSWTSSSELLDCISEILLQNINEVDSALDQESVSMMKNVLTQIDKKRGE